MKLMLIARPGYAPTAVAMPPDRGPKEHYLGRHYDRLQLALRLLGPKVEYDEALSTRWKSEVFCAPEFGRWWRRQPGTPPNEYRIFLETLKHA
jgi:hypothetical protein